MSPLVPHSIMAVTVAGVLAGCAITVELEPQLSGERARLIEKLPLTIGVFYNERFRDYTYERCRNIEYMRDGTLGIHLTMPPCSAFVGELVVNLGEASVAVMDRAMRALFEHVEIVEAGSSPSKISKTFGAIIEPEIQGYEVFLGDSSGSPYGATVTYRLLFRTPSGAELVRLSISGECRGTKLYSGSISTRVRDTTNCALRDVEARMLVGFREQPEVKRWLASRGIPRVNSARHEP